MQLTITTDQTTATTLEICGLELFQSVQLSRLTPRPFAFVARPIPSSGSLNSGSWILQKKYFLPNEPKVVQCLPGKLKKPVLANRIKIDQNRIKTPLKQHQTGTNEARIISISPVLRSCSGGGTPTPPVQASPIGPAQSAEKIFF
jgi:hypothetical protein